MEEIWKDIEGYEGLYQVSNLGRVKSFPKKTYSKERILTNITNVDGYNVVDLCKNGTVKRWRVARLVAIAFVSNAEGKPQVGHKDETRTNDIADNLEWVTAKENDNMPLRLARISEKRRGKARNDICGGKHPMAKKVICDGTVYGCIKDCAIAYNKSPHTMRNWLRGEKTMPRLFMSLGLKYYTDEDAEDEVGV